MYLSNPSAGVSASLCLGLGRPGPAVLHIIIIQKNKKKNFFTPKNNKQKIDSQIKN